ncbi:ABC transporter permease [Pseudonocardia humida]|uniref:ABC transporter permease n=1 Tax=Pseudonocardia humida TaxID=2800819 RepID=A0ABT1A2Q4_9PSEU|nr:ABC transporter permease [Pseudonocardia humida]MCO1657278.1 ABC transporter permease [Pseudonocardia humida]
MSTPLTGRQAIMLVARREFVTQVRSRSFVIGIVFTLVILAATAGVIVFVSSQTEGRTLGVTPDAAALGPVLEQVADQQGVALALDEVDSGTGRAQVGADELDALLSGGTGGYQLLYRDAVDSTLTPVVVAAAQQQALATALADAGVDPASLTAQAQVTPSTVEPVDPERGQQLAVALAGTFLLFMGLQYAAGVASGVVEEKQSRVVELLLATIKPWHLLTGKVLGIGAAGLLTMVILGAVAAGAAAALGLLTLPTAAVGMLVMVLVWYLIGFFLFAAVYAALGSTVSRQEELQSLIAPMVFIVIIPFILTLNLLPNDPRNPILAVLSFVPFLSQTVMPARYALGVAPLWEVALSALIAVVAIFLVVRVAARIYRNSILRTGARVSLLEALRSR